MMLLDGHACGPALSWRADCIIPSLPWLPDLLLAHRLNPAARKAHQKLAMQVCTPGRQVASVRSQLWEMQH